MSSGPGELYYVYLACGKQHGDSYVDNVAVHSVYLVEFRQPRETYGDDVFGAWDQYLGTQVPVLVMQPYGVLSGGHCGHN